MVRDTAHEYHVPSPRDGVDTTLNRLACELNMDPADRQEEQLRVVLAELAGRLETFPDLANLAASVRQACAAEVLPDLGALVVELDAQWSSWKNRQPEEGGGRPEQATSPSEEADSVTASAPSDWALDSDPIPAPGGDNAGEGAGAGETALANDPVTQPVGDEPMAVAVSEPVTDAAEPVSAGTTETISLEEALADLGIANSEAKAEVPTAAADIGDGATDSEPAAEVPAVVTEPASEEPAVEAPTVDPVAVEVPCVTVPVEVLAAALTEAAAPVSTTQPAIEDTVAEDVAALMADRELADMFVAEALDHLRSIEATVLDLEENPTDSKLLNDVFRPFHTIKGNAGALGARGVQEFAHVVENLLDLARSGQHAFGPREIEVVLKSVDLLTAMLQDLTKRMAGDAGTDLLPQRSVLTRTLRNLIAGVPEDAAPVATDAGAQAPAAGAPDATVTEPESLPEAPVVAAAPPAPVPPAPAPRLVAPAVAAQAPHDESPSAAAPARPVAAVGASRETAPVAAVKVDTRKLDNLVDMVGELVIVQSLIQQDPVLLKAIDERLGRNLSQLRRITGDLQRSAMAMRMVPIRQTFQKMARLVRDMSKSTGKQVELVLSGEDTELDRKMVEDIGDPLVHMVRNSLDHGLEDPETRARLGKRPVGRLALSAYHQGGSIVISISDDGGGLNAEKILAKAVQKGLVAPGTSLSQSEIHQLIFQPGFSTADRVTEISGRGVGLDVVRRNIELLRGRIEIHTAPGQGTTFLLKLPLTLAIIDGLLVRVGQQRFVVPTFCVRESLRPRPEHVHSVQGKPRMVQVRDSLVPIVHLSELFDVPDSEADPCKATVVVIEDDGRRVGLVVDQLLGKQEAVIKSLGEVFSVVRGVAGGAILGDGRVGLIVDAAGILALSGVGAHAA